MKRYILPLLFLFIISGCKNGGNTFNRFMDRVVGAFSPKTAIKKSGKILYIAAGNAAVPQPQESLSPIDTLVEVKKALKWEKFYYSDREKRDPFVPLLGIGVKKELAKGLSVEQAELVGTIWGTNGYIALVKEKGGVGYVLQKGDRVAGGRVSEVTQNSITFNMIQYGVKSKITLKLKEGGTLK